MTTELVKSLSERIIASPLIDTGWKVVYLRVSGKSITAIQKELGFPDNESVYAALDEALSKIPKPDIEKYRKIEERRLDALQEALWTEAMGGKYKAVYAVLRIMEHRAKLLGLNAPQVIETRELNLKGIIIHMEEGADGAGSAQRALGNQGQLSTGISSPGAEESPSE